MSSAVPLGTYYGLRGLSLVVLPALFAASVHPNMLVFILFCGLDGVATTAASPDARPRCPAAIRAPPDSRRSTMV